MKSTHQSPRIDIPLTYQIRVLGMLDESWSDWLEGMAITFESGSDGADITTLTGAVIDQADLYGVLNRLRDLNIPLLSVQRANPKAEIGACFISRD